MRGVTIIGYMDTLEKNVYNHECEWTTRLIDSRGHLTQQCTCWMKVNRIIDLDGKAISVHCVLPLEIQVAINAERFGDQGNMPDIVAPPELVSSP